MRRSGGPSLDGQGGLRSANSEILMLDPDEGELG